MFKDKHHILIVDDDRDIAFLLQAGLSHLPDCEIQILTSGDEAMHWLKHRAIDLLITDYSMPGMDGITLAQQARAIWNHLPVIMVTAFKEWEIRERASSNIIQYVFNKPIRFKEFRHRVATVLDLNTV